MMPGTRFGALMVAAALLLAISPALAQVPEPWQLGFQPALSPVMEQIDTLHDLLMWIITLISFLVLALLGYVCFRYRASRNTQPSRRTHNTVLEIAWTALPVLILVVIAIPSFKLLYYMDRVEEADVTLKAIGRQWYWSYEYPDQGNLTFDAYMVADADLEPGQLRLLTTDSAVVLPVETNIRLLTTASDVIHSWAMPSLGIKLDAIPGHMNETWMRIEEPGMYYGQCSELCGDFHAFMPIMIRAVPREEFDAWVEEEVARADGFDVAARPAQN
jgi:cytochrome c oxidase subunit 2